MRSFCSLVDILGDDTALPVECQGEPLQTVWQGAGRWPLGLAPAIRISISRVRGVMGVYGVKLPTTGLLDRSFRLEVYPGMT